MPHPATNDLAVIILAGGRATRFPGKLETDVDGEPLLVRVYKQLRDVAPVTIAGRDTFSARLDAALDCPIVVDRRPDCGPLGGLLSAALQVRAPFVFAAAGDSPSVTNEVVHALQDAWQDGDEAAVPEHGGKLEPLAALYDRAALIRVASDALAGPDRSMHGALAQLRVRRVPLDGRYFLNVNTAEDAAALRASV